MPSSTTSPEYRHAYAIAVTAFEKRLILAAQSDTRIKDFSTKIPLNRMIANLKIQFAQFAPDLVERQLNLQFNNMSLSDEDAQRIAGLMRGDIQPPPSYTFLQAPSQN